MSPPEFLQRTARDLEGAVASDLRSLTAVKEKHLARAVKTALSERGVVATTIVVPLSDWPSLGRSTTDIVVDEPPGSRQPRCVAELKWCQASH